MSKKTIDVVTDSGLRAKFALGSVVRRATNGAGLRVIGISAGIEAVAVTQDGKTTSEPREVLKYLVQPLASPPPFPITEGGWVAEDQLCTQAEWEERAKAIPGA